MLLINVSNRLGKTKPSGNRQPGDQYSYKQLMSENSCNIEKPTLQVLIITYKQEHLCDRIIKNIESYVCQNIEVLIQDDCSPDRTHEILANHFIGHPHVQIFRNEKNLGASRNSSSLISKATSEYVLNLGGDDFIVLGDLKKAISLIAANPMDIGIFNCARAELTLIDQLLFGGPKIFENPKVMLKNNQFTQMIIFNEENFYENIATVPGAIWGQGVIFRTNLMQKIQFVESGDIDDWGFFHNLAVHAKKNPLCIRAFNPIISLLAILPNSRGSNAEAQLTRQLCAVFNNWHVSFRKTALINLLQKKLNEFSVSSLDADEVISALKNSFSKI